MVDFSINNMGTYGVPNIPGATIWFLKLQNFPGEHISVSQLFKQVENKHSSKKIWLLVQVQIQGYWQINTIHAFGHLFLMLSVQLVSKPFPRCHDCPHKWQYYPGEHVHLSSIILAVWKTMFSFKIWIFVLIT